MLDAEGFIIPDTKELVKLKPYIPRAFKPYTLATDDELLSGVGGTLVCDTECYSNYFLIAFKIVATGKIIKFELTETSSFNERKLSWILNNYRVITFNGIKYDMPLIWLSYARQSTEIIQQASYDLIFENVWQTELQKKYNFTIHDSDHIDLIEVCPLRGSLKLYGARLHSKRIQDLPIDPLKPLPDDMKEVVADYCISNDLEATHLLFDNLQEQITLREELSKQYNKDLRSKSDAQIAETVISIELQKLSGKWPNKPKIDTGRIFNYDPPYFIFFQTEILQKALSAISKASYEILENGRMVVPTEVSSLKIPIGNSVYRMGSGGLHSSETNVAVKADDEHELLDRDVASYYPAIVLNCGLYPEHLGTDFLTVYKELVERRLVAKKMKNIAVSEVLKIAINGTFGKTGSPYSVLYAPKMMIQITLTGQLALLMLIEKLELSGIGIVSANTDGILIRCPKTHKAICSDIISMWETITGFTTEENKYSALYSRDVNAYMAIASDGKIKGKNVYYDPWRGKTAKDGYWRFQKNPNCQICIEAIEQLILKSIPIEQTIKECSDITKFVAVKNVKGGAHKDGYYLGKVVRWAYCKGIRGTINYISNNHVVPDTDGALPLMDLPDEMPDINHDYYIAKAKEMLYDMSYYQRPKQISFF